MNFLAEMFNSFADIFSGGAISRNKARVQTILNRTDEEALADDWQKVMGDLRTVIDRHNINLRNDYNGYWWNRCDFTRKID